MDTNTKLRRHLEQNVLPTTFYKGGASVILQMIGTQGDTMLKLYKSVGKGTPGYVCPYSQKEFLESHMEYRDRKARKSVLVIRVQMPAPEAAGLARACYFCYDRYSTQMMYYSSELDRDGGYRLWEIDRFGSKVPLDTGTDDFLREFDRVAELFLCEAHPMAG